MPVLALLLSLAARALALDPASPQASLAALKQTLAHGLWNDRMNAVHELGAFQTDAVPLLLFAADDADWQVRLNAVHYLGRLGKPAIPALSGLVRTEPCRHVRISALHWLGSMGEDAAEPLEQALDDESNMLRLQSRYWLDKMGRGRDYPFQETVAASYEDLRVCASSEYGSRLHRPPVETPTPETTPTLGTGTFAGAPTEAAEAAIPIETPPPAPVAHTEPTKVRVPNVGSPVAASTTQYAELDGMLGLGPKQTLPPGEAAPGHEGPERGSADLLAPRSRELDALAMAEKRNLGARERLPDGAAAPARPEAERPGARLVEDAGTPKQELDPVPALIEQLASKEWRKRARAADELGKRGQAAAPAVPALRKALRDDNRRVRASAALALGNVGDAAEAAVKQLTRALKDKDEDVRWSAAVALGRLPGPAARAAFRRYIDTAEK